MRTTLTLWACSHEWILWNWPVGSTRVS